MIKDELNAYVNKLIALLTPLNADDAEELRIQYEIYEGNNDNRNSFIDYLDNLESEYWDNRAITNDCNEVIELIDRFDKNNCNIN